MVLLLYKKKSTRAVDSNRLTVILSGKSEIGEAVVIYDLVLSACIQ